MGACTRHGMTLGLILCALCEIMAYHGDSTLWVRAPGME